VSPALLSLRRMRAILRRHLFLLLGSWPRLLDLVYWPTVQMVLWGLITQFLMGKSGFVAQAAGITLHVQLLYGTNNHHVCEAIFKGFARAMRAAVELDPRKGGAIPSTKGQLGG